ncbi:MAG: alpha/beta hydrolase [Zymomonas mobilis]|uniref:Pimeloyl-[acyl-carrier protein] methyl ester esterase n=1 Tax=Zymomonas mobilis TaxID=542 RepID=A0A542VYX4_ZYMMB|nr:alpha/beta hydrolase [Zymomonas mobilis]TQL16526.1 pimeloyl-[acyl-carrier protein] methyl ester esterase [Zymomonas mobilis]
MKTSRFLFVHGWGFDRNFWTSLRRAMGNHEGHSLDFGYFGQADLDYDWSEPFIAVGHSLGLLWLLNQPLAACSRLVSINGFSRFSADQNWPIGIPKRLTERMQTTLHRDAKKTVSQFYNRLGFPTDNAERIYDFMALNKGLEWLMTLDNRHISQEMASKISVLASDNDPIVPVSLTEACFPDPISIQWQKGGGHLLPLTEPDMCARFIRDVALYTE